MWKSILCFLNVVAILLRIVCCNEVFGCGGFLKSDYVINYSRVEIKLYTKHGSLKYHTDCAPHNGYYLIPVYDKGDYILKIEPPSGWSFEPSNIPLHIDGVSDPCSLNKDINFVFKGFTLHGQVLSHPDKPGPPGIKLKIKDSHSQIKEETTTDENGHYSFSQLYPGVYSIEAFHEKWHFDKSQIVIEFAEKPKTTEHIIVSGYDVSGSVFSDGEPVHQVSFLLFSEDASGHSSGCNEDKVKEFNYGKIKLPYLCHVNSSEQGIFRFDAVSPGSYKLIPFYKREHIEFDVSPSEVDFSVTQNSVVIEKSFQVKGFTVSGWIGTRPKGKSLAGVTVFINGEVQGKTDSNGLYHLENMKAGVYQLQLRKDLFTFDNVEMKISPDTLRLPDIYLSKLSMCGHLAVEVYPSLTEKRERHLLISSDKDEPFKVLVNADGDYCVDVKPGKYVLEPEVSEIEVQKGLKFSPEKQIIDIMDEPIMNVDFKQLRVEIRGRIKCIKQCENMAIALTRDEYHLKTDVSSDGGFVFQNCFPGDYVLTVIKDDWCFDSKVIKLTIVDRDVVNVELYHIGFQVAIILTHDSKFQIKYPSGDIHDVELQKSKNLLCLPENGVYEIIPVGCHRFSQSSYQFNTDDPVEINLSPTKHFISGSILTELNVSDVTVSVKKKAMYQEIYLKEPSGKKDGYFKYVFSVLAEPNSDIEVRVSSKQLLFRPAVSFVRVHDDCLDNAVEVIGKIGKFLNGSVMPPIEGVNITVYLKEGNTVFAETTTDKNGLFSVGPLEDISDYIVTAQTDGYVFTPVGNKGDFQAFKLAEIVVEVVNEEDSPLSGVLLSLSGGSDYRKNSITQVDGKLSFSHLSPGQYFLRPLLKEFSFDPSSKMIDIQEGTQISVKIKGKRVAYSLYGLVTSLTGEAEVGIAVEAMGVSQGTCSLYQEEAISEQGGAFRIRGLQPNCEYKLHLKPGAEANQHIERATPKEVPIKVTNGDIHGVRLIVFRYFGQMDLSGNVMTNNEYLQTLKVKLLKESEPDEVIHSQLLGLSSFFYLPSMPIDNKSYVLQLESSLSTNAYSYHQSSVTFCANTSFYHFTFLFNPQVKSVEQEVTQGSILALPLTIIALFIAYNYSKLVPLVSQVFHFASVVANPSKTSSENITSESNKKKTKPKRVL